RGLGPEVPGAGGGDSVATRDDPAARGGAGPPSAPLCGPSDHLRAVPRPSAVGAVDRPAHQFPAGRRQLDTSRSRLASTGFARNRAGRDGARLSRAIMTTAPL